MRTCQGIEGQEEQVEQCSQERHLFGYTTFISNILIPIFG